MRITKQHRYLALGLMGVLWQGGCATTPPAPPRPSEPMADPIGNHEYPRVVISPSLEGIILQAEPNVVRDEYSGTLHVTVPIRSVFASELLLEYRVFFLDTNGAEENPDTPWRYFKLSGRARRVLEASSLRTNTADWRMEIRPLQ